MRTRQLLVALVLATGSAALLAGCSGKPENSPAIRKKFAEIDKMAESVDKISTDVAMISEDVKRLSQENSEIRAFVPSIDATKTAAKQDLKVDALAAAPTAGDPSGATPENSLEDAPLAGSAKNPDAGKPAEAVAPAPEKAKETKKSTTTAKEPKAVASDFKSKTTPGAAHAPVTTTAAKAKTVSSPGGYHQIVSGETADTIAAKYNISTADLLKANQVPPGATLRVGQQVFVPGKK